MSSHDQIHAAADRHFRAPDGRPEKGSAMTMIKANALAVQEKSERLRALRAARDATIVTEPDAAPVAKAAKTAKPKTTRRKATV